MKVYKMPNEQQRRKLVERPLLGQEELTDTIGSIFADVIEGGDQSLIRLTKKFDGIDLDTVVLPPSEIKRLASLTESSLKESIDRAAANIRAFHGSQIPEINKIETGPGVVCWQEARAIERVGLYVPGGSAPLISTVLMLGIPAQLAGCPEIVLCTPPGRDGKANPAICYAALLVGVTRMVLVGGAQAIAAMAVGTKSVPKVDKIFGPGNQYVTAAKVFAQKYGVAIDMPAGPSEVMVIADEAANPVFVAADLLSQAEHGPDSQVVLVTDSAAMIKSVNDQIAKQLPSLGRRGIADQALSKSFCVLFGTRTDMFGFANMYAPEHLILNLTKPTKYLSMVTNVGSVFLGAYSPESAGDYASGTNHTLPTNGWARSYGGISVDSFVKKVTFQRLTRQGLKTLAPTIETLAKAEGLDAHVAAVSVRLSQK